MDIGLKDVSKMTDTERQVEDAVEAERRAKNCLIDIERILARWNCKINPMVTISAQGIQAGFGIVPLMMVKLQ